jgi:DNA replication protein DnaC
MRRALVPQDLEGMNLLEEFWRVKVQDCAEKVRPVVERYLLQIVERVEKGQGLILSGPEGVGKSAIGALVLKEARARGFTGYFAPVHELRECIRTKIPYDGDQLVYDRCVNVDVLVLDGLVAADATEHVFGAKGITELLASRAMRKKLTLITTRLDHVKLRTAFPDLIVAVEGCMVVVPVEGENRRRRQQEELRKSILGAG